MAGLGRGQRSVMAVVISADSQVVQALEALAAPAHAAAQHSGVVLLDVRGMDDPCGWIASQSFAEVVVLLAEQAPLAPLLDAGAVDFIRLPLPGAELQARVRCRLRRSVEPEAHARFWRALLDALPTPVFVNAPDRVVLSNAANARLFGRHASEVAQLPLGALHPDHPDNPAYTNLDVEVLRSGQPHFMPETFIDTPSGRRFFQIRKAPLRLPDGTPAVLGVAEDMTERRLLERQVVLADRLATMGTLAAGMAHEINNPLAYVSSNLNFALEELAAGVTSETLDEVMRALHEAQHGADRVRRLVQDLKAFSRPDPGEPEPCSLAEVVEQALPLARSELNRHGELQTRLESCPRVIADAGRLGQVVLNLLVNAAQAFPPGRSGNLVQVVVRCSGGEGILEIVDNGVGIAPAVRDHIFEPFFTTKPVGVGTGLGLSISQTLISGMGGRIEVDSEVGRGSTFRVTLPLAPI
jgi:two-component system NtrC family sensor kinase